jgi:hypothetical protein
LGEPRAKCGNLRSSWFLNAIITGFEIEQNGTGLQLREVTAAVR